MSNLLGNLKIVDEYAEKPDAANESNHDSVLAGNADIGRAIAESAFQVHQTLGAGFDAALYKRVLTEEFSHRGLAVQCNVSVPVEHRGQQIEGAFRLDFIVGGKMLVIVKAEPKNEAHKMLLASVLKHAGVKEGLLLNFYGDDMRNGIMRASYRTGNVLKDKIKDKAANE